MRAAAAAEEFEQATLERNRLRAVRSLLERRRVANESVRHVRRGRRGGRRARRQRAGLPGARRRALRPPVLLPGQRDRARAGRGGRGVHAAVLRRAHVDPGAAGRPARAGRAHGARRRARRPGAAGRWSCARPSAARSAGSSSWPSATRASRSTRSACAPSAGARAAWRRSKGCSRRSASTRRRSASSASTSPTSAARTRSPRWSCSRAARRRSPTTAASRSARVGGLLRRLRRDGRGARAALRAVGAPGRHLPARPRLRRELRGAAEPGRDRRRQGPARGRPASRCAASASAAWRSSRWPSASRRSSCPGARAPLVLDHSTPELQLLQRVRDEAHRFAITHHRSRRDRAMTSSLLDELPGVGPARKRALLTHFGSPEAVVGGLQRGAAGGARAAGEGRPRAVRPPASRRLSEPGAVARVRGARVPAVTRVVRRARHNGSRWP